MDLLRDLSHISKNDVSLAGGKGANLGEMIRAGFPVPQGFVILTSSFEKFLFETHLDKRIEELLKDIKINQISTIEAASEKIRDHILQAKIPQIIINEVKEYYNNLDSKFVAIRSSTTSEDSSSDAWAGQLETYLNITEGALFESIKKCWASMFTSRAISYRFERNLHDHKISVAVVVQKMVEASYAGVMFTANPISGDKNMIIIDGNPGLGESVVAGQSTPDHYVLRRKWLKLRIVSKKKGKRELVIKSKNGGGTIQEKHIHDEILHDNILFELAQYGLSLQQHFECPQDIEWAITGKTIFLLQSRPLTALPRKSLKLNWIDKAAISTLAEFIPHRPHPLDMSIIGSIIDRCRPHFKFFGFAISRNEDLWNINNGIPISFIPGRVIKPSLSLVLTPFRVTYNSIKYSATKWKTDPVFLKTLETTRDIEIQDFAKLSFEELLTLESRIWRLFDQTIKLSIRYLPSAICGCIIIKVILFFTGNSKSFSKLIFSGLRTKVIETNEVFEKLAFKIRTSNELLDIFQRNETKDIQRELMKIEEGREFIKQFHSFLDTHGYRESAGTILVSSPSWKESPDTVLSLLKTLALTETRHTHMNKEWTDLRDEILQKPFLQIHFINSLFIRSLQLARCTQEIKEDFRFYIMRLLYLLRKIFNEIGNKISASTIIELSEDVYWLTRSELNDAIKFSSSILKTNITFKFFVTKRKYLFKKIENTPFIDPQIFHTRANKKGAYLTGTSGSPGKAVGPVRIITSMEQFSELRLGDVLVAQYTNPSWTPLFSIAAAIVVDTGSILSHAAIVAREYGIPSVMATGNGTMILKDGDWVRVDGTNGCVYLLN